MKKYCFGDYCRSTTIQFPLLHGDSGREACMCSGVDSQTWGPKCYELPKKAWGGEDNRGGHEQRASIRPLGAPFCLASIHRPDTRLPY